MATFFSINLNALFNETIAPFFVSPTVVRIPFFSLPSAAADFINAGAGNDFVNGGGGADTIIGGAGNDTLTGGFGVGASVDGGSGNDLIFQVNGTPEFIDGGTGIDTLNTTAFGGNYRVNLVTGATNFPGETFVNLENLIMGAGNDTLIGTAGANLLDGGAGNDSIIGGGGADTVIGGTGNDTLTGGFGVGASVSGGDGNDLIFQVNGTPETINGGNGIDTLNTTAFGGNYSVNLVTGLTNFAGESFVNMENIIAGAGNDTLTGTAGANLLDGGAGNDLITGGGGADTVIGGTGNDTLTGGFGAGASVSGGDGNDLIFQVNGVPESINGGNGIDTLNTTAFVGNYNVNLATGLTNFAGELFINMENVLAGVGNDTLTGTSGSNVLIGGAGNDLLVGGGGNDNLIGGTGIGNDTLVGGQGRDILNGQLGDDVFDYNLASESVGATRDLITSFEFTVGGNPNDKIDLRNIDANAFLLFDQAFSTVEGNGIGQLSFSDLANGNTLIEGNTDFDAVKELQIEVADGATTAAFWSPSLDFFL